MVGEVGIVAVAVAAVVMAAVVEEVKAVMIVWTIDGVGAEVITEIVVWTIDGVGAEVITEIVVWEGTTEESIRLEFCPGKVRTGSWMPKLAQSS